MGKLRLGIIVDCMHLPAWQLHAVSAIAASAHTSLVSCQVISSTPSRSAVPSFYNAYDKRAHLPHPEALAVKDASFLLAHLPSSAEGLDVLLNLTDNNVTAGLTHWPRYGVWSWYFGTAESSAAAGVREVMYNVPVINSGLTVTTADGKKRVVYSSWSLTDPNSIKRSMDRCYWKSAAFAERMLTSLHTDAVGFEAIALPAPEARPSLSPLAFTARYLFKTAGRVINRLKRGNTRKDWIIMYNDNCAPGKTIVPDRFKKLEAPPGFFWADPMVVEHDGRQFIFIEEYPYATNRGRIAVMEQNSDGSFSSARPVLEKPYHLSYPFIFKVADKHYMIPESSENRTVDLYECIRFPYEWKFARTLLKDVCAVDATVLQHNGKWWLFTNIEHPPGALSLDELSIFYTDDIINSELIPHPKNPVISDVRRARPAGPFFIFNGALYRPSQVCAPYYGWGISVNRVLTLNEAEYEERPETLIQPDLANGIHGIHTLSYSGSVCVVDAISVLKK